MSINVQLPPTCPRIGSLSIKYMGRKINNLIYSKCLNGSSGSCSFCLVCIPLRVLQYGSNDYFQLSQTKHIGLINWHSVQLIRLFLEHLLWARSCPRFWGDAEVNSILCCSDTDAAKKKRPGEGIPHGWDQNTLPKDSYI